VLSALTEYPGLWKGGIDIVGIANFVTFLKNTAPWRRKHREAEYGSLNEHMETLVRISPINKIENIKASLFIAHGDNDERVPLSETLQIHDKLKEKNLPVKLLRFPDEGHGITKLKNRIKLYSEILQWLKETI
jgi:dipeptidyl aminopeptidase/acylaminoacyl peptidase